MSEKPISPDALGLLQEINNERGEMAVSSIHAFGSRRRVLNELCGAGLVGFVNYANGEHACMTDAGYDLLQATA